MLSIPGLRPRRHSFVHTKHVTRLSQKLYLNHKFKALVNLMYLYSSQQALLEACAVVPPCFFGVYFFAISMLRNTERFTAL